MRLLNFYGDTKNQLKDGIEHLSKRLEDTKARLEEAKQELDHIPHPFSALAPIVVFGFMTEHPMVSLGFAPVLYANEIKRVQEEKPLLSLRKQRKQVARRVGFLTRKKNRLEEQKETAEGHIAELETITSKLAKELVIWCTFEEYSANRLEEISEETIAIANEISAKYRGDLMIELFGTIDSPVSIATLTMKNEVVD